MPKSIRALLATALLLPTLALADMEVTTPDGRRVLLKDDRTWTYIGGDRSSQAEPTATGSGAILTVVNAATRGRSCHVGLRLTNNLPYNISTLVLYVTAYTDSDVAYDAVPVAFQGIRTTLNQYQGIIIPSLTCENVNRLQVHGGDRCEMGPYTKFSSAKGECLQQVSVQPSSLIRIGK
jgi:hypothetical protein